MTSKMLSIIHELKIYERYLNMKKEIFDSFFNPYAKTVDKAVNVSAFWRLSDTIISEIIRREVAPYCTNESLTMDAGGGTGRWAVKLCKILNGRIVVFDRSVDMLAKARRNIDDGGVSDRVGIVEGDLVNMEQFEECSVDNILSIYSPLSFIYKQDKAARELFRILKPGGRILVMCHGYFNALSSKINNYKAGVEELRGLTETFRVKWAPHVPELVTHSKYSIEKLFSDAGFKILKTYGVPVFVQPEPEDFDPDNERRSRISEYLENSDIFAAIFELEMRFNADYTVSNRGMNIFVLAEKKQ